MSISPHRYSGKPMQHHHTSYAGLAMILMVAGLMLATISIGVSAGTFTESGSIGFSGIVPGPPPASAPTIESPVNGQKVTTLPVEVRGSCLPGMRVAIARNGVENGSSICTGAGRFSLIMDLVLGTNQLVARQYDFLNQASPDSAPTTVVYEKPGALAPVLKPIGTRPVPAPAVGAAPQAPAFSISSSYKGFNVFPDAKMEVPLEITGGSKPYAVYIDWGDGTSSLISRSDPGTFSAPHTYAGPGAYAVVVKAIDSGDSAAHFQIGLVVNGPVVAPRAITQPELRLMIAWPIYLMIALLVLGFWLGERYELRHLRNQGKTI